VGEENDFRISQIDSFVNCGLGPASAGDRPAVGQRKTQQIIGNLTGIRKPEPFTGILADED
jgi:hypothetical protein